MTAISLDYGTNGCWRGEIAPDRLLAYRPGPPDQEHVREAIHGCVTSPLDFPSLKQALLPDDNVVLALDRNVPSAAEVIAELWSVCEVAGVAPEHVLILQPASVTSLRPSDPRRLLPDPIREVVRWKIHDPTDKTSTGYLASTAGGERLYLANEILEAGFVVPISRLGYDTLQGRRHALSAFYPGFSTTEAFTKSLGQGHSELGPDEDRPFKQLVNELSWLLGIQFIVQVLPSGHHGGVAQVLAGLPDSVAQRGQTLLDENWRIKIDERGETAVVSIPMTGGEATGWEQLGAALDTAHKLIERKGRMIVLSDLSAEPSAGIGILRAHRSAKGALKPLRTEAPPDLIAASQIATAADWGTVYLRSNLAPQLVEELFMTPLENDGEVTRLIDQCDRCFVIAGAQHAYAEFVD